MGPKHELELPASHLGCTTQMADAQVTLLDCAPSIQRATTSVYPAFLCTVTILLTRLAYMHRERHTHRYIPDLTRSPSSLTSLSGSKPETQSTAFKRSVKLSDLFEGNSLLSGAHFIQDPFATHNPRNQSIRAPIFELRPSLLRLLMRRSSFLNRLTSLEKSRMCERCELRPLCRIISMSHSSTGTCKTHSISHCFEQTLTLVRCVLSCTPRITITYRGARCNDACQSLG